MREEEEGGGRKREGEGRGRGEEEGGVWGTGLELGPLTGSAGWGVVSGGGATLREVLF